MNLGFGSLRRFNQHVAAVTTLVDELNCAGDFGEEGVIFAAPDVCSRFDRGPALADDDGAAGDKLAAESFYAKALRVGVAPVSGTAYTFLRSHNNSLSILPRVK